MLSIAQQHTKAAAEVGQATLQTVPLQIRLSTLQVKESVVSEDTLNGILSTVPNVRTIDKNLLHGIGSLRALVLSEAPALSSFFESDSNKI